MTELSTTYNPGLEALKALRTSAVDRGDTEAVARLDEKIADITPVAELARRILTATQVRRQIMQMNIGAVPAYGVIRSREED